MSSPSEPVDTTWMSRSTSASENFMTAPLPNCFSIWASAALRALPRSVRDLASFMSMTFSIWLALVRFGNRWPDYCTAILYKQSVFRPRPRNSGRARADLGQAFAGAPQRVQRRPGPDRSTIARELHGLGPGLDVERRPAETDRAHRLAGHRSAGAGHAGDRQRQLRGAA